MKHNTLSEKLEDQQAAALWVKELQERRRRADKATKIFKEKYTTIFLENIKKTEQQL